MKYLLIFSLITIFSCGSCDPIELPEKCKKDYLFNIPVTFSQVNDTLTIGDTIHFTLSFDEREVEDRNSGAKFDISGYPLVIDFGLSWIENSPGSSAFNDIDFDVSSGEMEILHHSETSSTGYLFPKKENFLNTFEIDLIPQKSGWLVMGFSDLNYILGEETNFHIDANCTENFNFYFDNNLSSDDNFNTMIQSPIPTYQNMIAEKDYFPHGGVVFIINE